MDYTVDVSWPQQNYNPSSGVIIAATSGDSTNGLFEQNTFTADITNARRNGDETGYYHFNGPQDAAASADYFWSVIQPYYQPGDVLALDIESGSFFAAQSPAWALAFCARLALNIGVTLASLHILIYGNRSTMSQPGWGLLQANGCLLWLASPGGYPENTPVGEWTHWTILQYSSAGGVDRDESELTFAQITNPAPIPVPTPQKPFYQRKKKTRMFGFIACNGEISIVYGDGANAGKRRALHFAEWVGYAAQGYSAASVTQAAYNEIPTVS